MIEQAAIVTQITAGQIWIKSLQTGSCAGCSQQTSCGSATFAKLLPKREFCVESDLSLNVGEQVVVAIDDSHLLSASILLYLLPVLLMVLVVALASSVLPMTLADELLPVIAFSVLVVVFWAIHRFQGLYLLRYCFKPQILRKIFDDNQCQ